MIESYILEQTTENVIANKACNKNRRHAILYSWSYENIAT